jgi:hypothetical protein
VGGTPPSDSKNSVMASASAGRAVARPLQSSTSRRSFERRPTQATTPKAPSVVKV